MFYSVKILLHAKVWLIWLRICEVVGFEDWLLLSFRLSADISCHCVAETVAFRKWCSRRSVLWVEDTSVAYYVVRTTHSQHPQGCLWELQLLVPAPDLHSPPFCKRDPEVYFLNKVFCCPLFLLTIGVLKSRHILVQCSQSAPKHFPC